MSTSAAVCSSRSAYVSRLRRAFLLRVHPDRFSSTEVRAEQAAFVQAFHQRIADRDFLAWQRHREIKPDDAVAYSTMTMTREQPCCFVIEKRDGSLLRETMALNDSVSNILSNMSMALRKSGAASIPLPPTDDGASPLDDILYIRNRTTASSQRRGEEAGFWKRPPNPPSTSRDGLETFLRSVDPALITSRQQARWDAKTVATVARREFGFVAVDATRTRWSSSTVAALFRRFVAISNGSFVFHVASFAPLRLMWCPSAREVAMLSSEEKHVNVYEGTLFLNPSATSVQWAHTLRSVTEETLEQVRWHRAEKERRVKIIQEFLGRGITIRKGYTCSSQEYFECLGRVTKSAEASLLDREPASNAEGVVVASGACVVVESEFVCRSRPSVTAGGEIQVGSSMSTACILGAISDLETQAREKTAEEQRFVGWSKDLVVQVQKVLGVQRVYRLSKTVSSEEFCDCLVRLLRRSAEEDDSMGALMSGHSLGIAATNHSCHVADDGSLVVPHNFA